MPRERGEAAAHVLELAPVGRQRDAVLQPDQLGVDDVLPPAMGGARSRRRSLRRRASHRVERGPTPALAGAARPSRYDATSSA